LPERGRKKTPDYCFTDYKKRLNTTLNQMIFVRDVYKKTDYLTTAYRLLKTAECCTKSNDLSGMFKKKNDYLTTAY